MKRRQAVRGFAYVLLLIAVAVIGVAASSAVALGSAMTRRFAEQELLAVGLEFQHAIRSYAAAGGRGPRSLDELLLDPRVPGVRRHLRQVYADPLTGSAEWGLVLDPQGSIIGVHSLAPGTPIQRAGFPPVLAGFEDAGSYAEWVFGLPRPILRHSNLTSASR